MTTAKNIDYLAEILKANVLDCNVIEIHTGPDETRMVHFLGYAYETDDDVNPYRILVFCGNIVSMDVFLNDTECDCAEDFNVSYNNDHHCYIGDYSDPKDIYQYYFDPELPKTITRAEAATVPDGEYILSWEG